MAFQLAKAINKDIFHLQFICLYASSGSKFERELQDAGVKIVFLNKGLGLNFYTFRKLWKALDEHGTTIVHTHLGACLYAAPWCIYRRKKLLHTVHTLPSKEIPSLHRNLLKLMYKAKAAIPISISETLRTEICSYYRLENAVVPLVYNPVNIEHFKSTLNRVEKGPITFVSVARLAPPKNHKMLLKAFARVQKEIPHSRLLLAGEGELWNDLQQYSSQLKISDNVHFLGNVENIPELLTGSDIFVLSSLYEGLPMTILEAMGAKLPVIATRVGGVPDIVKENGILIEANNTEAFAEAMILLAKDEQLRGKMGQIGYRMSDRYDIKTITGEYEQLYLTYTS